LIIKIDKHLPSPVIKAALFDLDGTILDVEENITSDISDRIQYISNYIPVSIVSGRIFSEVSKYSNLLKLKSPQISENGAIIFDPLKKNKIIYKKYMDKDITDSIFHVLDNNNVPYFSSSNGKHITHNSGNKTNEINIITCLELDITKLKNIKPFIESDKISIVYSRGSQDQNYISFTPKGINKSIAIEEYKKLLNLKSSEIFAIGDGLNDIEMLKSVGISVAMGNSYEEVFKVCNYFTKNFNEAGTIIALDWIIKGIK
jgi:HAD superfamily hydrolase (TIGR01484 family)|tara:strand:- start:38651 stop:39427 length:777 start_codon:yes stop_codon:yes gene_type:complete